MKSAALYAHSFWSQKPIPSDRSIIANPIITKINKADIKSEFVDVTKGYSDIKNNAGMTRSVNGMLSTP
jgi:hypothetical protein